MNVLIFIGTFYFIKSTAHSSLTDHNSSYKDEKRETQEDPHFAPVSLKRLCAKKIIGKYADPDSCNTYFICSGGTLKKKTCQTGELFDKHTNGCKPAETVDCLKRKDELKILKPHPTAEVVKEHFNDTDQSSPRINIKSETQDQNYLTQESLKLLCAKNLNGTYIDDQSCNKYFECSAGNLNHKTCPTGEMFDLETSGCMASNSVNCLKGRPHLKVLNHQPTVEVSEEKRVYIEYLRLVCARKFIGKYADIDTCDKYYDCIRGKLFEKTCPDGELFDNRTIGCKPSKTVDCLVGSSYPNNNMTEEEKKLYLRTEELKLLCAKKFIGRFEDVDSCSDYYECVAGKLYKKTCPKGESFDNENLVCNAFETVKCKRLRIERNSTEVCTSNFTILTNNFGATYEHRGRKYEISLDYYNDYHESENTCRALCGHLADVEDKEEENFILDVLRLNHLECVLIAGHDRNKNGIYLNEVTQERLQYINWAKWELKRKNTKNHCLLMRNGQTGMFKSPCSKTTLNCNFVCKIRN